MAAAGSPSVFLLAVNGQIESGQVSQPGRAVEGGGPRRPPEGRGARSPATQPGLGLSKRGPGNAALLRSSVS